jgi:hypothetical protein
LLQEKNIIVKYKEVAQFPGIDKSGGIFEEIHWPKKDLYCQ